MYVYVSFNLNVNYACTLCNICNPVYIRVCMYAYIYNVFALLSQLLLYCCLATYKIVYYDDIQYSFVAANIYLVFV